MPLALYLLADLPAGVLGYRCDLPGTDSWPPHALTMLYNSLPTAAHLAWLPGWYGLLIRNEADYRPVTPQV